MADRGWPIADRRSKIEDPKIEDSPLPNPFHIMAKPVSGVCNLDCAYCYYTMKPRELYPEVGKQSDFRMSDEVLASYTRQYLEANPVRCEFGWQGGEPTLAGVDFFRRAVELQKEFRRDGQEITNGLQTNGTLLDDEFCEFLAAEGFLVGVSLDGPPQWHDFFRRDHDDKPSFHRAWRGLELCRKHGVEFNVLVTLNSMNAPHAGDIYRYFVNRGIQYVQFIPILERISPDRENAPWEGDPTPFSCTPEQFAGFMHDVFVLWASRDVGRVSERLIDSVLHTLLFGRAATCCYADRCANAHVLEWNGDLYVCDHFVYRQWKVGNIMETPLADLVRDPMLEEFAKLKTDLPDACRDCEFLRFCRSGCPKHHIPIGTDPKRANYYCEGLKAFFREAIPILEKMVPYLRRNQTPPPWKPGEPYPPQQPSEPGRVGPATSQGTPAGPEPARNAPCPCGSGRKYKHCCGKR